MMNKRGPYARRTAATSRLAVAYLRSELRLAEGGRSAASGLQLRAIRKYGQANGYTIAHIYSDPYRDRFGMVDNLPQLECAMRFCQENDVKLFYVSLSRWRRNDVFKRRIAEFQRNGGRVSSIECDEIVRHFEERYRVRATLRSNSRAEKKNSGIQRDIKILGEALYGEQNYSRRKIHNYILISITNAYFHITDLHERGFSDREIANELNIGDLRTVDGKQWTKDTVRKTRNIIVSKVFEDFLKVFRAHGGGSSWFRHSPFRKTLLNSKSTVATI